MVGFFFSIAIAHSAVQVFPGAESAELCNESQYRQSILGFRVSSLDAIKPQGWSAKFLPNGIFAQDVLLDSNSRFEMDPAAHSCIALPGFSSVNASSSVVLYKTSSCHALDDQSLGQLHPKMGGNLFRSGPSKGRFALRIPVQNVKVSNTTSYYNAEFAPGPLTWMGLAMLSEYFSIDPVFLLADWSKETGFLLDLNGKHWYQSLAYTSDAVYGPGEVEAPTLMSRALSYPQFFQQDSCLNHPASLDQLSPSCQITPKQFADNIMGAEGVDPQSAQIINAEFASALVHRSNFDVLNLSTDLSWKAALSNSPDSLLGMCALLGTYNLGINSGIAEAFRGLGSSAWIGCASLPRGFGNYNSDIVELWKIWKAAQVNVNLPELERWITKSDIARFFFGDSASTLSPWLIQNSTQKGGLLRQFYLSQSAREELWRKLDSSFTVQSARWDKVSGEEVISLKEDWVGFLAMARPFFDIDHALPRGYELKKWIADHSNSSTDIYGEPLDRIAPKVEMQCQAALGGGCSIVVSEVNLKDRGIQKVEWSLDSNLQGFLLDHKIDQRVHANGSSSIYVAEVPAALNWDGHRPYFLRVSDSCGNALVLRESMPLGVASSRSNSSVGEVGGEYNALGSRRDSTVQQAKQMWFK